MFCILDMTQTAIAGATLKFISPMSDDMAFYNATPGREDKGRRPVNYLESFIIWISKDRML